MFIYNRGFIREQVEYERSVQGVFSTDRYVYSGDKKESVLVGSGGTEKGGSRRVAKILLLLRVSVTGGNEG